MILIKVCDPSGTTLVCSGITSKREKDPAQSRLTDQKPSYVSMCLGTRQAICDVTYNMNIFTSLNAV